MPSPMPVPPKKVLRPVLMELEMDMPSTRPPIPRQIRNLRFSS